MCRSWMAELLSDHLSELGKELILHLGQLLLDHLLNVGISLPRVWSRARATVDGAAAGSGFGGSAWAQNRLVQAKFFFF